MPEKWTVSETEIKEISGMPCWQIALLRPDGARHFHLLPGVALEWRAAEYGVDPEDVDTLLEIVLHEPHMPAVDDPRHGFRFTDGRPDLWTADTTDDARAAHLARVKECPVQISVRGVKALDPVRVNHRPTPESLRLKREAVDTTRWLKRYGDLPAKPLDRLEARRA